MAVPRVFVSSTYYDLKQYRSNIAEFIHGLGYEPIMHERQGVAYTQEHALETDCYHELASCDIAVCIIGNHFGSKSLENDLSVTMNEIKSAIKQKIKVYIFIANDVYTENRTYLLNKDTGSFKSAFVDDIKIHEFIAELKDSVRNHFIAPFETTDQIISTLRAQFAGLLQNLLQREASMTDAKTAYDLQQSADSMKAILADFVQEKEEFFKKFDSSIYTTNWTLRHIKKHLGLEKSSFFASNIEALDEIMLAMGFSINSIGDTPDVVRCYAKDCGDVIKSITLMNELVDKQGNIKDIRKKDIIDKNLIYSDEVKKEPDFPF